VILVPVLLLLVLVVIFAGRLAQANTTVRHAADEAARAASQASTRTMAARAREVAFAELHAAGIGCVSPAVGVALTGGAAAHSVVVTVTCELDRQALAPLAPGAQTISATSAEVIDVHRGDGL
jgi:Flp pilus assembly protein TadG